jgi:hypothetical protein
MDVCESGVLQKHGITHVDVAGHPEGSKNVPSPFEALSQKVFLGQFALPCFGFDGPPMAQTEF